MDEIPDNGRTLKRGDPLRDAILAEQRDYKAHGVPYPCRFVDEFYAFAFVWLGRVPYRADTLERLVLTQEARKRPIPLPDHFVLDGGKRLPGENASQYAKYLAYRDLGPGRSLNKVARVMGRKVYGKGAANSGYYSALASRFRWAERVAAHDAHMEIEARRAAQAVIQEQMQDEVQRRSTYLANEWASIEKGFAVLHEMLKYPVVEKKYTSPDGKTTIWQPGKWTYASVAQMIGELTKIGRLHAGLSTSNSAAKVEATHRESQRESAKVSADDAAHEYASRQAEDTYFRALEEWQEQHATDRTVARVGT